MREQPITPENSNEVSGEINPNRKQEQADKKRELGEQVRSLEIQRDTTAKNYQAALKQMEEIKTGPKSENLHAVNLELLGVLQKEIDVYKERHKGLESRIDDLKDRLGSL